jgi:hypothetical protein
MSATGSWMAIVDTPTGPAEVRLELVDDDGHLTGTSSHGGDTVKISEGNAEGNDLSWKVFLTNPIKMTMIMNVTMDGDTFAGTAKPNVFPAEAVTGTRL